jgi:hypothetical protein
MPTCLIRLTAHFDRLHLKPRGEAASAAALVDNPAALLPSVIYMGNQQSVTANALIRLPRLRLLLSFGETVRSLGTTWDGGIDSTGVLS